MAHETLSRVNAVPIFGTEAVFRVQESHDFDLLHRFWSSHEHPMKPSVVVDVEIDGAAEPPWTSIAAGCTFVGPHGRGLFPACG